MGIYAISTEHHSASFLIQPLVESDDNGEAIVICCLWAEFLICWFDLIFKREVLSKNSGVYNIFIAK